MHRCTFISRRNRRKFPLLFITHQSEQNSSKLKRALTRDKEKRKPKTSLSYKHTIESVLSRALRNDTSWHFRTTTRKRPSKRSSCATLTSTTISGLYRIVVGLARRMTRRRRTKRCRHHPCRTVCSHSRTSLCSIERWSF